MKGVIDVMAMQKAKQKNVKIIDYSKATDSFTVARFIFECGKLLIPSINWTVRNIIYWWMSFLGLKLEANVLTISTAATLFHRFMREAIPQGYDPYVSFCKPPLLF